MSAPPRQTTVGSVKRSDGPARGALEPGGVGRLPTARLASRNDGRPWPAGGHPDHPVAEAARVVLHGGHRAGLDDLDRRPSRCASHARHPPRRVMSVVPARREARTGSPSSTLPSASSTVPIVSGAGTSATKLPNAAASRLHTSTSSEAPLPGRHADQPGLGRVGRQHVHAVVGRGRRAGDEAGPSVRQLVVERLALEVRAAHRQGHVRRSPARGGAGLAGERRRRPPRGPVRPRRARAGSRRRAGRRRACPTGTATAHKSSRFAPLVKRPRSALVPTGSSMASARVGWRGTVGRRSASTSSHDRVERSAQAGQPVAVGGEPGGRDLRRPEDDAAARRDRRRGDGLRRRRRTPRAAPPRTPRRTAGHRPRGRAEVHLHGLERAEVEGPERRRRSPGRTRRSSSSSARDAHAVDAAASSEPRVGWRDAGSSRSQPAACSTAVAASARSRANTVTQSRDRMAGTTPRVDSQPRVGLMPTIPHSAAGTRPDPAVSVPSASRPRRWPPRPRNRSTSPR